MTSDQTTHRIFHGIEAVLVWIGRKWLALHNRHKLEAGCNPYHQRIPKAELPVLKHPLPASAAASGMHYGHPDFLDGFWASNRGSLSKASPAINLSEDRLLTNWGFFTLVLASNQVKAQAKTQLKLTLSETIVHVCVQKHLATGHLCRVQCENARPQVYLPLDSTSQKFEFSWASSLWSDAFNIFKRTYSAWRSRSIFECIQAFKKALASY